MNHGESPAASTPNSASAPPSRGLLIPELLNKAFAEFETTTAVEWRGKTWTYGELRLSADRLAHAMRERQMAGGAIVAVFLSDRVHMVTALLAILRTGGVFVPLDPHAPIERLRGLVTDLQPALVLCDSDSKAVLDELQSELNAIDVDCLPESGVLSDVSADREPEAMCYIYFTSGSTGKPKGICGTLKGLSHFIRWEIRKLQITPGWRVSQLTIPTFDAWLRDVLVPLCSGGTICIPPEPPQSLAPGELVNWIGQSKLRLIHCVPSLFATILKGEPDPERIKDLAYVLMAGEVLPIPDVQKWRERFGDRVTLVNLYGPTETTMVKFCHIVAEEDLARGFIPIGQPIEGAKALLLDAAGKPCPKGVAGEIYIRTPYRTLGYFRQPELTAEVFIQNPFNADPKDLIYKTGDRGRVLTDGNFQFIGRMDRQVKLQGVRIELGEIEAALGQHPLVTQSAVLLREDRPDDKRLVAYLVTARNEDSATGPNVSELREFLRKRLPDSMLPSTYVTLDKMPLLPNGKLDRKQLPAPDGARPDMAAEYVAPRSAVEHELATLWGELLGVDRVGIHDNFFDLGGHSLLAMQLLSRVRTAFDIELPLREVFETPTVATLATAVAKYERTTAVVPIKRISREEPLPLSFAQQRLWLLDQLMPQSALYNIPASVRLSGPLDRITLQRAFTEIVRRHEVLRSTFVVVDVKPRQIIGPPQELIIESTDLSNLPAETHDAQIQALTEAEAQRPFDLRSGPLLRVSILQLAETEHVLLVTVHHVVSDGWSFGVLLHELSVLYRAFSQGQPSPLAELTVQYADYAQWQREWLQGEVLEKQLEYWKKTLTGAPALQLATDRPRPPMQTHRGASYSFEWSEELWTAINQFSRQEEVTPFMSMLAAFNVLLSQYSGQDDISVGTPIAGRRRPEVEELIGFFVNNLVMRTDLSGNPTLRELVARVRNVCLDAYAHQDVPFEKLVEVLQPQRDLSRDPLFQVMLVLQNLPASDVELPDGLTLRPLDSHSGTARFEMTLFLFPVGGGLRGRLDYNSDLFDAATSQRFIHHLELIVRMLSQPETKLNDVSLLLPEEQAGYDNWNDTARSFPSARCLHELIAVQAETTPERIAVRHGEFVINFRELNRRANQFAHFLREQGVGPESRVAVCLERSPELVVAVLGILKAGGAYVPLDPSYPPRRLQYMLQSAEVLCLVVETATETVLAETGITTVHLERDRAAIARCSTDDPHWENYLDAACYIIYTSGSTGDPKGVVISHRALLNTLFWMQDEFQLGAEHVVAQKTASSFTDSVWEIFWPLLAGTELVIIPAEDVRDPHQLFDALARFRVTHTQFVPPQISRFLAAIADRDDDNNSDEPLLSHLQWVFNGGELLPSTLAGSWYARLPHAQIGNIYGMTESAIYATNFTVPQGASPPVLIGVPLANTRAYVVNRLGRLCPLNVPGELYLGGIGLTRGYHGAQELTALKLVPDSFGKTPGERLYRTGDRARWLPNGQLEYLGRIDHQINIRGFRVELREVEHALLKIPEVGQAAVTLRKDRNGEPRLVAYIKFRDNGADTSGQPPDIVPAVLNFSELRRTLLQSLPEYMVPSWFEILDELPVTASGKVDRARLPVPTSSRPELEAVFVAPRNAAEQELARLWSEVLGVDRIGIHDNFFDLGGHSLLAMQLLSRVQDAFDVELRLRDVFEFPTVAGLAELIGRTEARSTTPPIVPVPRDQPLPLSFAQQRLWLLDQLVPNSAFYNIPAAVRLSGRFDPDCLRRAFTEIVRRHEVLRTTFAMVAGEPRQFIAAPSPMTIPLLDLTDLTVEQERDEHVRKSIEREAQLAFDLSNGPLLRASLLKLTETEFILLVTLHHVVSDGWSTGVLLHELSTLYDAFARGLPSPLPELPLQYADYAVWQRDWLQGEVLERQLDFWKDRLADAPVLQMPVDHARPKVQTYRGGSYSFQWPASLWARVNEFSRQEGATPFMTLLAAFNLLLAEYSGQDDISIGTPIAGRRPEIEGLIGFFVNSLVMRTDLSGNPTFRELLGRVREVCLEAYTHQDVPFEKLVEALQPQRDLSREPLFQVMLVLQNLPATEVVLPDGLTLHPLDTNSGTAKFDITLFLAPTSNGGLGGRLEYSVDLFEAEAARRLIEHLTRVLEVFTERPQLTISELTLLGDVELSQLQDWNRTPQAEPEQCLHHLIAQRTRQMPDRISVREHDAAVSYRELNARANQLAHYLRKKGVGPEARVGLFMKRSTDLIIGILGILKAGGAYVPLDPTYPRPRLEHMLRAGEVTTLVTQRDVEDLLPVDERLIKIDLDGDAAAISACRDDNPDWPIWLDNACYVIHTSGSTGQPKGVVITHRTLLKTLFWMQEAFHLRPEDVVGQKTASSFTDSVWEIFWPLLYGSEIAIIPDDEVKDSQQLYDALARYRVTYSQFVPPQMSQFLEGVAQHQASGHLNGNPLPDLKWVFNGGEALSPDLARAWNVRFPRAQIGNIYGMTESTIYATEYRVPVEGIDRMLIGRPIAATEAYVLSRQGQLCPVNVTGELYLGGDRLTRGYSGHPDLTAEKLVPNPFGPRPGGRLYRTGDLARWLPDGEIEYLGRVDFQVNIHGYRVEIGDVEAALRQFPGIRQAAVMLREDQPGMKRLVAYVTFDSTQRRPNISLLRRFLLDSLPDYMVPSWYEVLEEMPTTPSGKLDRRRLPVPDATRPELESAYVAPRTSTEKKLVALWIDLLKVDRVGIHDSFFDLGGHSLLAMQLFARIRETFHVDVSLRTLFQAPTILGLSDVIARSDSHIADTPVTRIPRGQPLPLSFAQQRLWVLDQLVPDSAFYNIPAAVRLDGPLNPHALQKAFSEIVRRHEILRTTLTEVDGEPRQLIQPASDVAMLIDDLRELSEEEQKTRVTAVANAEAQQGFDLRTGPLLRIRLLRLGETAHVLLLTMHHVVSDGWSTGVLLQELSHLYRAFVAAFPSPLPELPVQYADFAHWQREWLQGDVLNEQVEYWRTRLTDAPLLQIPTDRPRPAMQTFRGNRYPFRWSDELSDALGELCRHEGVTTFMALLAALDALLAQYSGQDDIVVGTAVAGRRRPEFEGLIGFFVNSLVMRTDLSGNPTYSELLARVREVSLEAFAHQDIPFDKLVEELQPQRDLSREPLFQVMFVLQNTPVGTVDLPDGLSVTLLNSERGSVQFDLVFSLSTGPGIGGAVHYNTDLFDQSTIVQMVDRFERLLTTVVADSAQPVLEISLDGTNHRETGPSEFEDQDFRF